MMSDKPLNGAAFHGDPGLQPERTALAWARTMMALVTVSAIFLRWLPHHGPPVLLLVGVSMVTAAAIYLTQRHRYRASVHGITTGAVGANISPVVWTGLASVTTGIVGVCIVLTG